MERKNEKVRKVRKVGKVKVALGLSGGVDSAVSAYLLQKQGFDVHCVYLNCYDGDALGCRGDNDRKDALAVAMHLGLPFQVLDFRKEYQAAVIDYFKKEYLAGRTPNPDVVCNRDIKFGLFMDWAIKAGFDYVATGHYADGPGFLSEQKSVGTPAPRSRALRLRGRRPRDEASVLRGATPLLRIPTDLQKDQTYFLWAVPREKFKRVLFPLGNLLKAEVREIALKIGLPVAKKKDSTGICFVGEVRVEDFLKKLGVREKEGEVVMKNERRTLNVERRSTPNVQRTTYNIIGSHRGVWFYTIGQRHGFGITNWPPLSSSLRGASRRATWQSSEAIRDKPVFYVIGKDIKKNRLIVGFGADCYRDSFEVAECNWLAPEVASLLPWSTSTRPPAWTSSMRSRAGRKSATSGLRRPPFGGLLVRLRHGGELIPCSIVNVAQRATRKVQRATYIVRLSEAQRGIAPGQSAVFYDETGRVLGGGIIL